METILLISNHEILYQTIAAYLPENWVLVHGDQFDQVQKYLEEFAQPSDNHLTMLVDIKDQPEWVHQITRVKRNNVLVFGLIDDPEQQEAAIRAGASDYLLKPWLASEIKGRLIMRLQEQEIIQVLLNQIIQKERQASIGRLTSYICHDINNAMQATGGALDLAMEESDLSDDLGTYLTICRQETRRVVKLLERMRQIYRPQGKVQESIQLDSLLQDVLRMISEETSVHDISLDGKIETGLPAIRGVPDQLYLAFLSILLNLYDGFGSGGGSLRYQCYREKQFIQVEFFAAGAASSPEDGLEEPDAILFMEPARSLIIANNGEVHTGKENRELFIRVRFPTITN